MLKSISRATTFFVLLLTSLSSQADDLMPPPGAAEALLEYNRACMEEGGELWGASLCGPMLIVEPASRVVMANVADVGGLLQRSDDLYIGVLPEEVGLANTAQLWSGTKWSMVLFPLPENEQARSALFLHEAWHRLQGELSLPAQGCNNNHLENRQARIWMRLEWRALARALGQGEQGRDALIEALVDALLFRQHRQDLFAGSARQEALLEMNEGLAEFTGLRAAYDKDVTQTVIRKLAAADHGEHLVRSFAYVSGPAYGLLLDVLSPGWRSRLDANSDLGQLLTQVLPTWPPAKTPVEQRAQTYGYAEVSLQEEQLGRERAHRQTALRKQLVDAPGLVLPLEKMEMQFNPNQVSGLAPHGTVYFTITIRDSWGKLEATAGALISSDFRSVAVPGKPAVIEGRMIIGDTWRLELDDGWRLIPAGKDPTTVTRSNTSIKNAPSGGGDRKDPTTGHDTSPPSRRNLVRYAG